MENNFKNQPGTSIPVQHISKMGQPSLEIIGGFNRVEEIFLRLTQGNMEQFPRMPSETQAYILDIYLLSERIAEFFEKKRKESQQKQ